MKKFEREASEAETTSSVETSSEFGSGGVDAEVGLLTPARSLSEAGSAEQDLGSVEEVSDLNFVFDDRSWTEDINLDRRSGMKTSRMTACTDELSRVVPLSRLVTS